MLPMTEVLILNTTAFPIKKFYSRKDNTQRVFCENETNTPKLYGAPQAEGTYFKDGINNYIIYGSNTVNPEKRGTKASFLIDEVIGAGQSETFEFRLCPEAIAEPFQSFDEIFTLRKAEAEEFYNDVQNDTTNEDERNVQRQAFAGLLWNKQFYHYNIGKWLKGDPNFEAPRNFNDYVRNTEWNHLHNKDIISMLISGNIPGTPPGTLLFTVYLYLLLMLNLPRDSFYF